MLLGVVLVLPSLWAGLHWDDIPMARNLSQWLAGSSEQAWWDIFELDRADPARRFGGRVPWWAVDNLFARFFRPVAALTHLLDHAAWPTHPMVMHAQSIAWFAALSWAVLRLYRMLLPQRVATVAGILFASSYVHAIPVGWLSNRNAVLAAVFGFLSCAAYVRWRERKGLGGAWAPLLLILSLLSSEAGIATMAIIIGFEFTRGAAGSGRWTKITVMVLVVVLWRVAYSWAGFGAMGSGGYIDPIRSPAIFLHEAGPRLAWLLAFLLTPLRLLIAHGVPKSAAFALGAVFALAAALVVREAVRAEHRLWLTGVGLCLLPALAAAPGERLLTFAIGGLCPIVAATLLRHLPKPGLSRVGTTALVLTYGIASPVVLLLGSFDQSYDLRRVDRALPTMAGVSDEELRGKNLFVLHAPGHAVVHIMRSSRERAGMALPSFTWNLFPTDTPPQIVRDGCCSLEIGHSGGLSRGPFVVYFRGIDSPMHPGDTVETLSFTAEVLEVTDRGVPTKARFTLKEPLESYRNVFVTWNGEDFEPVRAQDL